jgi:hypothetical protein
MPVFPFIRLFVFQISELETNYHQLLLSENIWTKGITLSGGNCLKFFN